MFRTSALAMVLMFFTSYSSKAANCEVVKYSTTIDVVNRRIVQTDTVIIRIINRSGEDYGKVSIDYFRDNPITNLSGWILDRNGNVVRYLKNREITESNTVSSSFYTDYFTKKFTLKHNEYPYYIAYTYQTTEKQYISIANWHPVIGLDVPTLSSSLTFRHPEELKINIVQNHINNPEVISSSGIITHRWNAVYDGKLRPETFGPDPWDYLPTVQLIPLEFEYGLPGNMSSWQSLGAWQYRLNMGLDELPESEKTQVQSLIQNIKNKKEIVRALYHYLQDYTRYVNVQIGIGGLKPYPAAYVAKNKFGDCKALSIYMKALLKYAGIESYYVLVDAGEIPGRFYNDIPFLQFNHAMIAVPLGNDTIWLENTNNTLPFGYNGVFTQNRRALLIDGNESRLVNIPPLHIEMVTNSRNFHFDISEYGGTNVTANFTFKAADFEVTNNWMLNYTKEDQNDRIHGILPFPAFELYDWKMMKTSRDAEFIKLSVSAEINQLANPIGDQYYFSFQQTGIPDLEMPQARRLPVQIPYPIVFCDTLTYQLPSQNKLVEVPHDAKLENKYGEYTITFQNNGDLLTIYRRIILYPVQIDVDEYADFYNFIYSIKSQEKLKILFQ